MNHKAAFKSINEAADAVASKGRTPDKYGITDYSPYRAYLEKFANQEDDYDVASALLNVTEEEDDIDFTTALANYYFENDGGRDARLLKRLSKTAYQAIMDVAMDIFEGDNLLRLRTSSRPMR